MWDAPDLTSDGFPDLGTGAELPSCAMTIVAGEVAFELEGALA